MSNKSNKEKLIDKLQIKIRVLEKKLNGSSTDFDKTTTKLKSINKQLEERHDTVKKMNY